MRNRFRSLAITLATASTLATAADPARTQDELAIIAACVKTLAGGLPLVAQERTERFQGKVDEARALCRGGETAARQINTPWVDWENYWATGGAGSKSARMDRGSPITDRNKRGVN